jgi:hypothetical protein
VCPFGRESDHQVDRAIRADGRRCRPISDPGYVPNA